LSKETPEHKLRELVRGQGRKSLFPVFYVQRKPGLSEGAKVIKLPGFKENSQRLKSQRVYYFLVFAQNP